MLRVAGELVFEGQAAFANSAPALTVVNLDIPSGGILQDDEEDDYEIIVRNPSAVTALTVTLKSREPTDASFGGGSDRYPVFQSITVPASSPEGTETLSHGWNLATKGGRITVQNVTILGGSDAFSADVRVRKL